MLTPYQFSSNTPIWATDLDGREARIYNDVSVPVGHTFLSVIDKEGIINVYTYGQYGEGKKNSEQGPLGIGVLVHLKGAAANTYINGEFKKYPGKIKTYEISERVVDKEKVIKYFSAIMDEYSTPATSISDPVKLANENAATGSSAVEFGHYEGVFPGGSTISQNCTSVVKDALRINSSSIVPFTAASVPQDLNFDLWLLSKISSDYKNVTDNAQKNAADHKNETHPQQNK
jgi:hypothetical protein